MKDYEKLIEEHREEIVTDLLKMIELPSSDEKATVAQELVQQSLIDSGFKTETFMGLDERSFGLADYCEPDIVYDENAYNVVGTRKGTENRPSLMLFAHIDTERDDYFGIFENPYQATRKDGKIYGLGSSDDKGGICMMIQAVKYALTINPDLPYDLTVLSILGKHGGATGTLSAMMKGYTAEQSIYLHPAETGHGFAEIKNISLGAFDLDFNISGKPGKMHDDLDTGVNANVIAAYLTTWLEEYNQKMRKEYIFDFGSFKGEPSFVLNVGTVSGNAGYGGINQMASVKVRIRFYKPLTADEIISDIKSILDQKCVEYNIDPSLIHMERGNFRASPAIVETDDPFVTLIKKNISEVTGITEFIHQYHGGSDIRLPILYGNSKCVGIGPSCILPEKNSGEMEWIDEEDYISGVKILTGILLDLAK